MKKPKTIKLRKQYGDAFLILGSVGLAVVLCRNRFELFNFSVIHKWQILWCAAVSLLGMGSGIINSRDHGSARHKHYWIYFVPLVFPLATISGLTAGIIIDKSPSVFYLVSFLVSFSIGFTGDSLAGRIESLSKVS